MYVREENKISLRRKDHFWVLIFASSTVPEEGGTITSVTVSHSTYYIYYDGLGCFLDIAYKGK